MATQYSEISAFADEDDDGLLEILSKDGVDIQGDTLAQNPVELGEDADAVSGATSVGVNSIGDSNSSLAVGRDAQATATDTTAVGTESRAPANWNTVFGYQAGSNQNGENVVVVGRKAEAQGDDAVSIGENARANGNQSAALGKACAALADNASVLGQGSTVSGAGSTVIGQDITVDVANATGVGTNITVGADGATAIGSGATATGIDSLALGRGTTVSRESIVGFGDRDIDLPPGRSIKFGSTSTSQTLVDLPTVADSSQGTRHEFTLDINGEPILLLRAESDGQGGIQNRAAKIAGSFALDGDTNQVDDVVTGNISIEDGSGTEQVGLDATATPVDINLHNNPVQNFRLRNGTGISYQDDPSDETLVDFTSTSESTSGSEQSYSLNAGGVEVATVRAEADGNGGVQNVQLRLNKRMEANSNSIVFGSGSDIGLRFDSESDSLVVSDETNSTDLVDVDKTSGDVSISGELTEGAAL